MLPEISEFSYGFALTNEIIGITSLKAAPIFPSLIEEGKKGGGYDVKLDAPAVPLYLQFKRAECMKHPKAKEIAAGAALNQPYHRFKLSLPGHSLQHESLIELDDGQNAVFYAAPRFHTLAQINEAWSSKSIGTRSIFVRPQAIGTITNASPHTVAYDGKRAYLCSEPHKIEVTSFSGLVNGLIKKLEQEKLQLRQLLPSWIQRVRVAVARANIGRTRAPDMRRGAGDVRIRAGHYLDQDRTLLRQLSDDALELLNSQLIVVQPN